MQQTILDDLKLQLTHRTNNLTARHLACKELCHTFIRELLQTFGQLLRLHRVGILHIAELLGRETRNAFVVQDLSFSQSVTDFEVTSIIKTHDVAWISLVQDRFLLCHESRGVGELQLTALAHMEVVLVTLETARHHTHKCNTIAMVGVHVGVNLENEARKLLLRRLDAAFHRVTTDRRRRNLYEAVQQLLHTEVIQGRAKENGADITVQIGLAGEVILNALYQFRLIAQGLGILTQHLV